jgi:hypothetical protein
MTRRAARLLKRFENAARELSWLGGRDPDAHDEIQSEYKAARKALMEYIGELEKATEGVRQ